MVDFLTAGSDYFPGWLKSLFSIGLGLGLAHHAPCMMHCHGSRWFHTGHVVMSLSMIYMYLSMSYLWTWLPGAWQMWFFAATTVVVGGYLVSRLVRRGAVNLSWVLLLVGYAAMIYMWYPMMSWNAIAIFVLVSWFAIETFGWAADLLPDDVRRRDNHDWLLFAVGPHSENLSDAGHLLIASSWQNRGGMAVMALSTGYVFYGMELMRWAMTPM